MFKKSRIRRHKSVRRNIAGSEARPRLAVFRSNQHIYAQIIDDSTGKTVVFASDIKEKSGSKIDRAKAVGENISKKAIGLKIKKIVFDRGGFKYHGRIAALAEGARKGGLEF
ncbi:50S ribosomal protein L18 [Candidatus Daviesbacteria bacterium]|nr:50S ribosomal protein L18 [Candidatus Daviesbacteria bacterium]